MKRSSRTKPISYTTANAADVLRGPADEAERLIVTHNGEATAVLQDISAYEQTQETLALITLLALGKREIVACETKEASAVFAGLAIK